MNYEIFSFRLKSRTSSICKQKRNDDRVDEEEAMCFVDRTLFSSNLCFVFIRAAHMILFCAWLANDGIDNEIKT